MSRPKNMKRQKHSMETVLQDSRITSLSDVNSDVPCPSDSTVYGWVKGYNVSLPNVTSNKTEDTDLSTGPYPSDSSFNISKPATTEDVFKKPFIARQKAKPRTSLFDVDVKDSDKEDTPEQNMRHPFQRKAKAIVNSDLFELDSSNENLNQSSNVPKFIRRQMLRRKKNINDSLFDKALETSDSETSISTHSVLRLPKKNLKKVSSAIFDDVFDDSLDESNANRSKGRKQPFNINKKQKSVDSALFDSDLNSSVSLGQSISQIEEKENSKDESVHINKICFENPVQSESSKSLSTEEKNTSHICNISETGHSETEENEISCFKDLETAGSLEDENGTFKNKDKEQKSIIVNPEKTVHTNDEDKSHTSVEIEVTDANTGNLETHLDEIHRSKEIIDIKDPSDQDKSYFNVDGDVVDDGINTSLDLEEVNKEVDVEITDKNHSFKENTMMNSGSISCKLNFESSCSVQDFEKSTSISANESEHCVEDLEEMPNLIYESSVNSSQFNIDKNTNNINNLKLCSSSSDLNSNQKQADDVVQDENLKVNSSDTCCIDNNKMSVVQVLTQNEKRSHKFSETFCESVRGNVVERNSYNFKPKGLDICLDETYRRKENIDINVTNHVNQDKSNFSMVVDLVDIETCNTSLELKEVNKEVIVEITDKKDSLEENMVNSTSTSYKNPLEGSRRENLPQTNYKNSDIVDKGKRVSFKLDNNQFDKEVILHKRKSGIKSITNISRNSVKLSISKQGSISKASLDSLIFEEESENCTSGSAILDLYASKSKSTSNSLNSNFTSSRQSKTSVSNNTLGEDSSSARSTDYNSEFQDSSDIEPQEDTNTELEEETLQNSLIMEEESAETVSREGEDFEENSLNEEGESSVKVSVAGEEENEQQSATIEKEKTCYESADFDKENEITNNINKLSLIRTNNFDVEEPIAEQYGTEENDANTTFNNVLKNQNILNNNLDKARLCEEFKKPLPKRPINKRKIQEILDNVPLSELKKKKRIRTSTKSEQLNSTKSREQLHQDEIEEALLRNKSRKKTGFVKANRLKKPRKWVTQKLYDFIIGKLQPNFGLRARVRAENVILFLVEKVDSVLKCENNYFELVEEIKAELASLEVVHTHWDFYKFAMQFCDGTFTSKVFPVDGDIVNPHEPKDPLESIL